MEGGAVSRSRGHPASSSSSSSSSWVLVFTAVLVTVVQHLSRAEAGVVRNITGLNDLNHLVVDGTGHVYLGAVNTLYKLSPDLRSLQTVQTGPTQDNVKCVAPFSDTVTTCGNEAKMSIQNYNKVLVVDTDNARLLTCGSVQQGTCQFRMLSDISNKRDFNKLREQNLAANDATSSTIAFIAPGPPDPKDTKVIYSATTLTAPFDIRMRVPIIASRKLTGNEYEALTYVHEDTFTFRGSFLKMEDEPHFERYNITYVAGFNVGKFNYFLSVQQKVLDANAGTLGEYVTKIIRICEDDNILVSYVEIPLECGKYSLLQAASVSSPGNTLATQMGITVNEKILVAAFAEAEQPTSSTPKKPYSTGICVYSFKEINERFVENIQNCFRGPNMGSTLVKHIKTEGTSCIVSPETIDENFCGLRELQDPINAVIDGGTPMFASTVIKYQKLITAVAVSRIEEHTIAFLGTIDGKLKKLVVQRDGAGMSEYEEMTIDPNQPILPDMKFDPEKAHLYVMTKNKVFKVQVSNCDRHTSCKDCAFVSSDPYCGWCSLERKCNQKRQCANSEQTNFWLSQKSWGCVQISKVEPDRASIATQVQVTMTVDQLPYGTKNDYACMFDGVEVDVDSSDSTRIQCTTPPSGADLPQIPRDDQDHVNITLGIKSVNSGIVFVEKSFSFYNCSIHASCTMCTMAKWGCNWCVYDNKCISQMETCPNQRRVVADTQLCPQLLVPSQPILVPVGMKWEIKLQGRNLPQPLPGQSGYKCFFHHRSPPDVVDARLVTNSTIVCEAKEYTYIPRESEKMAKVDVVWNNNFYIDDENDVQVTFYKCDVMGEDCSLCISLADTKPHYMCRWCGMEGCVYKDACKSGQSTLSSCPRPRLHGVMPLTGPLGGNTPVTISGSNLGTTFEHIDGGVTVAGKPCKPLPAEYKVARQIVCLTSSVPAPTSGPVVVKIGDANATWMSEFVYQDPVLEKLSPNIGPMAGGTEVTITGKALNTGVQIKVRLDSLECELNKEVSESQITCLTSRVPKPRTTKIVRVIFDGHQKKLNVRSTYNYTINPNITNIYPTASYISGGRTLTVEGKMFDVIQKPQIFLKSGMTNSSEEDCQKVNDTQMLCPTPNVKTFLQSNRRRRAAQEYPLKIGFKMDGVTEVTDLPRYMPWVDSTIKVYTNPVLYTFSGGKQVYSGGALVLQGEGLTLASTMSEIKVSVGNKECEVETLSPTKLVCKPPTEKPSSNDPPPKVVVTVGNEEYPLGLLEYQTTSENSPLPQHITIVIAITGTILVLIIIIILIIYRRKSTEAERQFKKMQIQLDTLESNVRNECKQAFAELQTEVTDLTSDLNVTGIPFWDYKTYTFKVLFPSHTDHPVLHNKLDQMHNSTMKRPAGQELGLQQFNQLLNSKQFLITFIRTLESQKNFSIRDKAVVASLLMIVLQDKMEYATEILKALLSELIDRSVEKKHPKLMLRRTESVVEKFLTNWLSICMYSYLKKHAGKSMFLLYKAIKHQTEKGPVDAITSEARYSLSEDRLLREKIEPKTLTINLVVEHEAEMVSCKVLDCDTITQAKEKCLDAIYMNTPCSRRPAVYDVDLEWRSGRSGHLPLQDEDVTTQMVNGWKRINTLAHYHVPDGAIMAISPTRNKNDLIRHQHGMVEITPGSPFSGIKPIVTVEEGHKVWHLVKHDDLQNQSRAQKVISEIFLTRLLSTKGTLQQFIDDLFLMILKVDNSVPPAIKYLFDFLDQAARRHNIVDQEVVHTWKSNSLPLRFWVNLIKNPEFVFDIRKSNIVDSCLSVIAQTFMDSCSTMEHRLGKDSPSNKLLFARDIPKYRKWVEKFYKDVQEMPPVSDHEMNEAMIELSTQNIVDFNVPCALKELYRYAQQYNIELLEALDEEPSSRKLHLANKFEQVTSVMDGTPLY